MADRRLFHDILVVVAVRMLTTILPVSAAPTELPAPPQYKVASSIPIPGPARWDYLHMDTSSRRLFIAHGNSVDVLDVDKAKLVGVIKPTPGVHGVAIDHRDGLGFASAGGINSVVIFNLSTLQIVKNIPVGHMPDCIIYDRATDRVFAFDGGSNEASAIDCKSKRLIGNIPLDGRPEFAVAGDGGYIYVNVESKSQVAKINARTLRVVAVWPLAPGQGPSGITIDTDKHLVFSTCHNGMMTVINDRTGRLVATPSIGTGPDAACFDRAWKLAFSSNGEGTISVIGWGLHGMLQTLNTIATEPGARTMAIDSKNHDLLVCTAKPDPAPLPAGTPFWRKPYLYGTLHVLILQPVETNAVAR